jgi:hypothetical protein
MDGPPEMNVHKRQSPAEEPITESFSGAYVRRRTHEWLLDSCLLNTIHPPYNPIFIRYHPSSRKITPQSTELQPRNML